MRAQLVRTAVLEIYEEVRREGARADQALQRVLRREKALHSVERRAVSDAVYGLLRLQGRVDHLLSRALATRGAALEKLATPTQHLLRYAAYLVTGEGQSAQSAVGVAGPGGGPRAWGLQLVAAPPPLGPPAGGAPDAPPAAAAPPTPLGGAPGGATRSTRSRPGRRCRAGGQGWGAPGWAGARRARGGRRGPGARGGGGGGICRKPPATSGGRRGAPKDRASSPPACL